MKQQLENLMYDSLEGEKGIIVCKVEDLNGLSASVFYIGSKPIRPLGSRPLTPLGSRPLNNGPLSYEPLNLTPLNFTIPEIPNISSKPLGSSGSGFKKASEYGLGPGIAKETEKFIERYRAGKHENYGMDHVNLDILSPVTKKPLLNLHINFNDED